MAKRIELETTAVNLPGGWSGRVVTVCPSPRAALVAPRCLPTLEQWLPVLRQLITDASALPGRAVLKSSRDVRVIRAEVPCGQGLLPIICKQTRARGLRRRAARRLQGSRERRNFARAVTLLGAGIRTPLPLALIERRSPSSAWLITHFVADLVDLDEMALRVLPQLEPAFSRAIKETATDAVVDLFDTLERHRLFHRDLKASNILLADLDHRARRAAAWIVDLDGLRRCVHLSPARRWQPLMRLGASLLDADTITRADHLRFLRRYLRRTRRPKSEWKAAFRRLAARAGRYRGRSARRKTHKLDGFTGEA
ncbi:MAG: lipopolysaccharide kinase InaA family protein [Phycisphaerae bacterium]